jgi:hypothetical protein
MPLINYLKVSGPSVRKVLEPDERLIDLGLYLDMFGDDSRLARRVDELPARMRRYVEENGSPPPRSDQWIEGFDIRLGGLQVNQNRIARFLGGLTGEGAADSIAGLWWRATTNSTEHWDHIEYGVTDRRLLLLTHKSSVDEIDPYKILYSVPRSQVVSARRKAKLLFQWGRVEVRFTDGSMIAWCTGMLSSARARSLVATLSTGESA